MAIATSATYITPSPRHAATAPVQRVPSRVYSPFPLRRLTRPMAVPAAGLAGEGGRRGAGRRDRARGSSA